MSFPRREKISQVEQEKLDRFNEFEWNCGKNLRPTKYDNRFHAVPSRYEAHEAAMREGTKYASKDRPASSESDRRERVKALSECGWKSNRFSGYKALGAPDLALREGVEELIDLQRREWNERAMHAKADALEKEKKAGKIVKDKDRFGDMRTTKYNVDFFVPDPDDKQAPRQAPRSPQYKKGWQEVKKELSLHNKVQKFMVSGKTFEDAHRVVERMVSTQEYSVLPPRKLQSAGSIANKLMNQNTFGVDLLKEKDGKISLFGGIHAKNTRTARDPMMSRPATADAINKARDRFTRGYLSDKMKLHSDKLVGHVGEDVDMHSIGMRAMFDGMKENHYKSKVEEVEVVVPKREVMVSEEDVERVNQRAYVVPMAYGHEQHADVIKEEVNNFADAAESQDTDLERRLHAVLVKRFPTYRCKSKSFHEVQQSVRINEPTPSIFGAMRLRAEGYEIQSRVDHIRHHPWYEGMCTLCGSHMLDRLGHTVDPTSGELLLIHHVRMCLEQGKEYGVNELKFTAQQFTYEELQSRQLGSLLLYVLDKLNVDPFKEFCEWYKEWNRYDDVRWLRLSKVSPWATSKFTARWRKKTAATRLKHTMFSPMRRSNKKITAAQRFG